MVSIIGCDENNYSPSLVGPVIATALLVKQEVPGVRDSKKLTHRQRLALLPAIQENSVYTFGLGTLPVIERVGIASARSLAIAQALMLMRELVDEPTYVLIDGYWSTTQFNWFSSITHFGEIHPGKDEEDYSVAAASIVGKIYIDALFSGFGAFYNKTYGASMNKGGVSTEHKEALRKYGPSAFHRPRNYGRAWWRSILGDPNG